MALKYTNENFVEIQRVTLVRTDEDDEEQTIKLNVNSDMLARAGYGSLREMLNAQGYTRANGWFVSDIKTVFKKAHFEKKKSYRKKGFEWSDYCRFS